MNNEKEILINQILELSDDVPGPAKYRKYLESISIERLSRRLFQLKKEQIKRTTTDEVISRNQ